MIIAYIFVKLARIDDDLDVIFLHTKVSYNCMFSTGQLRHPELSAFLTVVQPLYVTAVHYRYM